MKTERSEYRKREYEIGKHRGRDLRVQEGSKHKDRGIQKAKEESRRDSLDLDGHQSPSVVCERGTRLSSPLVLHMTHIHR